MRPLLAIVLKDLKLHLSNRRALIITLAVPIAIASFFGSIFGGGSGKTNKPSGVPIQVADLDQSVISREIVTNLLNDSSLRVTLVEEPAAREAVRLGKVAVAVIFPKNFGEDATRAFFRPGKKPGLTVLHDPSRNLEASMVQGILMQHIMQTVSKNVFSGESGRKSAREALADVDRMTGLSPDDSRVLRNLLSNVDDWLGRVNTNRDLGTNNAASGGLAMPFSVVDEESAQPEDKVTHGYNGYAHSFGGMSMQFTLMASIEWGLAILVERQLGLWRRVRSAPLSRKTLLAGRAASSTIIAFCTLAICWIFSLFVFHVQINGSLVGFVLCNLALAIFAACMGLFIAALGRTPEATRGIAIFVILIMVMLGGAWVPSFIFPEWLQKITVLIPTRWAMDGFDSMTWRGLGLSAALAPVGVLLGYSALCAFLAHRVFRWEAD